MTHYCYDVEVFPNFFSAVFIPIFTPKELIEEYIQADIAKDRKVKQSILERMEVVTFMVYSDRNDLPKLIEFMKSCGREEYLFAGYNNLDYDDIILDYIYTTKGLANANIDEITEAIYELSVRIIDYQFPNFRRQYRIRKSRTFKSVDLYKLNYLDKNRVSLKHVQIALKWHRVLEYKMPKPLFWEIMTFYNGDSVYANALEHWHRHVIDDFVDDILDYNVNDTLSTLWLFFYSKKELKQRMDAIEQYGVGTLSDSRSKLADRIMAKSYMDITGYDYWSFAKMRTYRDVIWFNTIISPKVKFQTKELQKFLSKVANTVIKCRFVEGKLVIDKFEEILIFRGTKYKFAKGGLHSVDTPKEFNKTNKYLISDVDADSYYPTGIVNLQAKAEHLSNSILNVIHIHTTTRITAKKEGDKSTADILKIVLNSGTFGKLGFENSWMYDLQAMYKVTINLQLMLLMLIEDFEEHGIDVISANTDGIVARVPIELYDTYVELSEEWGKKLNFGIEFNEYVKYVRTTVNDYMAIKPDGKIKTKGDFVDKKEVGMGYFAPVIARTLQAYYKDGTKPLDYLKRQNKPKDIYDFCISVRIGAQYEPEAHSIVNGEAKIETLQKYNRYFVSNSGVTLLKNNKSSGKLTNMLKGQRVTVFNDFFNVDKFTDYNINYNWYLSKVQNFIDRINNAVYKDAKNVTGSLFDNL